MNELISVNYDSDTPTVSGRELHKALEIKARYNDWFRNMCEYGFKENEDYTAFTKNLVNGGRSIEHALTIDMAKELCMIQRNDKGREIRRYFIEVEKRFREQMNAPQIPQTTDGKIVLLAQGHIELRQELDAVKEDVHSLKMDLPILPIEADRITTAVKTKGMHVLGGKDTAAYKNKSLRQRLYKNLYSTLKYNFGVQSYKSIKRSQCDIAIEIIQNYAPPYFLVEEIQSVNNQYTIG